MRVLHIIDGIGVGGAELVLIQLVEGLEKRGVRNTILTLTPAGILRDRIIASGADLVEMNMAKGRLPWSNLVALVKATRASKADVIQGWMYHGNFAATVLRDLAMLRTPMFWSMHNTLDPMPPFARVTRLAYLIGRMLSWRPVKTIYVSKAAAEQHLAEGFRAANAIIVPNGTDCTRFAASAETRRRVRADLGVVDGEFLLGCLARWALMKGHPVLFEAVARLKAKGLKPKVLLAGTLMEATNPELRLALQKAGVEGDCLCLGERRDADRLMTALDGLVLPSIHGEAFPMVLGEAMATEVVCVATDVGDSAYLMGDTGLIAPPSDVAALTGALEKLMVMGGEARASLGHAARHRVATQFSIERMVASYLELYQAGGRASASPVASVETVG